MSFVLCGVYVLGLSQSNVLGGADLSSALRQSIIVEAGKSAGDFPLVAAGKAAPVWYDEREFPGVIRAIGDLAVDIHRVTDQEPMVIRGGSSGGTPLIIGTLGRCEWIDALATEGKIPVDELSGKWESFVITTVAKPAPGIEEALVIAGSDKRGTIYGVYELSRQIGVSPWHWWADTPIQKTSELLVKRGVFASGEPKVKYRGIFINDEAPALRRWAEEKYGGMNERFYARVFELLLRSKANYLWPAMWLPTAFNDDFPGNPRLADEYGIVMSTSHHEPMMRAHHEWERFGGGAWNYETNGEKLREFWRKGYERVKDYESVVTVGMRGDGDEAMSETTAVPLMQRIITDQRKIISEVSGLPAEKVPQVWALYKEVQDYYDQGMKVPDDILILFSDDNWGNIRYLPRPETRNREGGYGMYYHVDYVGAPVSYRWLNVSQIERIWEQMKLTYAAGVDRLWIVNVGDIKPMELPMSFFLDLAWDPDAIEASDLPAYYRSWSRQQFGQEYSEEVSKLLESYTKFNARRTPEMLSPDTYSVLKYREADRIVGEYKTLAARANELFKRMPETHRAAFQQLVLFPIEATANVTEMYTAAGKNDVYAARGMPSANLFAERVKELFARDAELTRGFHRNVSKGKWNHMMSQTHLGYTYWNHPPLNRTPPVTYVQPLDRPELGFYVEHGDRPRWGWLDVEADWSFAHTLPRFDRLNDQRHYIEVFNRGGGTLEYTLRHKQDWIRLSKNSGTVEYDEKIDVSIDWSRAPQGKHTGEILVAGAGAQYTISVPIANSSPERALGFIENNGVVSIPAESFERAVAVGGVRWAPVPNLGRTGSAVTTMPIGAEATGHSEAAPSLEYVFTLFEGAEVAIETYVSPTLNFREGDGLKFAISVDDAAPQVININKGEDVPDWKYAPWWMKAVGDRIRILRSSHGNLSAGPHVLRVWMVDPGVVLQKFVVDAGGLKPSYLGPPSSLRLEGDGARN